MDRYERIICDLIDRSQKEIIAFGRDIWSHGELGFQEFRTARAFSDALKKLGIQTTEGLAVTGVKGYLKNEYCKGRTVALIGEYDALPIQTHPDANPETGASHCCGHNAQITAVMGAAIALTNPEVMNAIDGNIIFFGVPAEEFIDIERKSKLIKDGVIGYGGGKCELIRIGAMDDIDIAVGHHASTTTDLTLLNAASNGFVNKRVCFTGRASHAAGNPQEGIDADSAALLARIAIDLQRESFRDTDTVRIHGFTVQGGNASNIIADRVILEYSVRANNIPAIIDASRKFDRAMKAGATATGAGLSIQTLAGYLPTLPATETRAVVEALQAANTSCHNQYVLTIPDHFAPMTGSTDFGDVSSLIPTIQFGTGGYQGSFHSPDITVTDEYLAYVMPAKIFALTGYQLLKNGGTYAQAMLNSYQALMTKEEYKNYMNCMTTEEIIPMIPLPHLT